MIHKLCVRDKIRREGGVERHFNRVEPLVVDPIGVGLVALALKVRLEHGCDVRVGVAIEIEPAESRHENVEPFFAIGKVRDSCTLVRRDAIEERVVGLDIRNLQTQQLLDAFAHARVRAFESRSRRQRRAVPHRGNQVGRTLKIRIAGSEPRQCLVKRIYKCREL